MKKFPKEIRNLIDFFIKFPGVGPKTAQRYAIFLVKQDKNFVKEFIDAILSIKNNLILCRRCFNLTYKENGNLCDICKDKSRDQKVICVVEDLPDLLAIESIGRYKGTYFVLGGTINPILKATPDKLKIKELVKRIKVENPKEVILALNTDTEGEATSLYLKELLNKEIKDIKITRIGKGLPQGGDLEYADEITLSAALENRREF